MKTVVVTAWRDTYVRNILRSRFSAAQIARLKKEGEIRADGARVRADFFAARGTQIAFLFPDERAEGQVPVEDADVKIVYEDEDYLVCDKGAGILSVPDKAGRTSLLAALGFLRPQTPFHVLTRLDKDTRGLVLVAKSSLAASAMRSAEIQKFYLAEAEGEIKQPIRVTAPIAGGAGMKRMVSPAGKEAETIVTPLFFDGKNTLAECRLLTGRTHQIRVHLAYIGHPVAGDSLYGNGEGAFNGGQKLLCARLVFTQPFTKETIDVRSEREFEENK